MIEQSLTAKANVFRLQTLHIISINIPANLVDLAENVSKILSVLSNQDYIGKTIS